MKESVREEIGETWRMVAERLAPYSLVLPGDASFVCLTDSCPVHCCKVFSVSLGERERTRLAASSGLPATAFLECDENGEPIVLPLAQPYLLARREGTCALLAPGMLCGQYEGRPDACRLYPHFVLAFDRATMRPLHDDVQRIRAAVEAAARDEIDERTAIVLVRHNVCPGFEGPPLEDGAWRELLLETAALQYTTEGAAAGRG